MKDILYFNTLDDIKLVKMMRISKSNEHDYSKDYLTFEMLTPGSITMVLYGENPTSLAYSIDKGKTWVNYNPELNEESGTYDPLTPGGGSELRGAKSGNRDGSDPIYFYMSSPELNAGDRIMWKGDVENGSFYIYPPDKDKEEFFNVEGNPMSVINSTSFSKNSTLAIEQFSGSFCELLGLKSAKNLFLSFNTLSVGCFQQMFDECINLTEAPKLQSKNLAPGCYYGMFSGTSLTAAPELPATTLAEYCYRGMFKNCTSLTKSPDLPAETLVINCYREMFYGCTSLNYIKAMFLTTPGNDYTYDWVQSVASNGTFVRNPKANWDVTGTNGIPTMWITNSGENDSQDPIIPVVPGNETVISEGPYV